MSNVVQLSTKDAIDSRAAEWIARLDRGLTSAEEQQLQLWLNEKEAHREALLAMAELWDKMDDLSRLASLFERPPRPQAERSYFRSPAALAACFVAITVAVFLSVSLGMRGQADHSLVESYYQTSVGKRSVIDLPDTSRLILNTDTLVKVEYSAARRLLILERGEIHIDVAHNKARPLSVVVQDKVIEAVGTAFNVKVTNPSEVELIVTDGTVRVAQGLPKGDYARAAQAFDEQPQNAKVVVEGEKLLLGSEDFAVQKLPVADLTAQLSWRDGNLVFRGETLAEALIEISRYTSTTFEIADAELRQVRIAGLFKAGDVNGLLTALKQNFQIKHERVDNKIVLSKLSESVYQSTDKPLEIQ